MAHQCSLSKMFNTQGARRASQVTPRCHECNYFGQTFLTPQGKASHKNAHRGKDYRLKKRRTPNCRVKLRDVLLVPVQQTGVDSLEAGVSEEVDEACDDSSTAGVSEEVQEVVFDSSEDGVSMEVQEVDYDCVN